MWTLHDAKNKFSALVDAALAGVPQEVTRRGKPTVVVVAAADYQRLVSQARDTRGSFVDHLLSLPADSEEWERAEIRPREVEL